MVICGAAKVDDEVDLLKSTEKLNKDRQGTALNHLKDHIDNINGNETRDTDIIFLKGILDGPVMASLVQVQDRLEERHDFIKPVSSDNNHLLSEVRLHCERRAHSQEAQELASLLYDPHLRALIEAHDLIALRNYEHSEPGPPSYSNNSTPVPPYSSDTNMNNLTPENYRMIGIRKLENEPLGITVKNENGRIVIARIMSGGIVDRQGLLHVGDAILQVNGNRIETPEQLHLYLRQAKDGANLKIIPSYNENRFESQSFMKALYSYDPSKDTLLPCKDIGLAFNAGEILQIVCHEDPNWWQAKKVGDAGEVGLIPSQELEERRRAFVRPEFDYSTKSSMCGTRIVRKKKKTQYISKKSSDYDKAEIELYEEVARMPPFERKTLILIGAQGVGKQSLKDKLIAYDPKRFGTTIPHTSRPIRDGEHDGKGYFHVTRDAMEADIEEGKYLEYGEFGENLYGTKLSSIRAVIRSGKMCVIDCSPQCLKKLNNSEFMPYVIFVNAPHMETLKHMHNLGRSHGYSSHNLTFNRAMHRSRRAKTLESLASLYEEEDVKRVVEESARMLRAYDKYFDHILTNDNFDLAFEKLLEIVNSLSTAPQWIPVSWFY